MQVWPTLLLSQEPQPLPSRHSSNLVVMEHCLLRGHSMHVSDLAREAHSKGRTSSIGTSSAASTVTNTQWRQSASGDAAQGPATLPGCADRCVPGRRARPECEWGQHCCRSRAARRSKNCRRGDGAKPVTGRDRAQARGMPDPGHCARRPAPRTGPPCAHIRRSREAGEAARAAGPDGARARWSCLLRG